MATTSKKPGGRPPGRSGVRRTEAIILSLLSQERLTFTQIVERIKRSASRTTVSRALASLEDNGHVVREWGAKRKRGREVLYRISPRSIFHAPKAFEKADKVLRPNRFYQQTPSSLAAHIELLGAQKLVLLERAIKKGSKEEFVENYFQNMGLLERHAETPWLDFLWKNRERATEILTETLQILADPSSFDRAHLLKEWIVDVEEEQAKEEKSR